MPHIEQLSSHVADLIAAGEVVERPASVVKELCENAIDAGAHAVTVEVQNGGMSLIRVTDDGCGIASDEVETAFLRHATSKLRTEYDLEAIGTLGFRGEALAATAAVARVELLTRRPEDALGVSLRLDGGVVAGKEEAGCPAGSTLLIRDLFYNTPARLKFMKKDSAEGAACLAAVQHMALSHPEVSFKFLRDGKQELLTPGDGQLRSALYSVLGRDMALGYLPVEATGENGLAVTGFTSLPTCCRGTRGYQFFFVNGRYIKSRTMTAALEQAYANQRMVGKFPGCVLQLTAKLNAVDVNVHPTKQEVKFGSERQVFSAVYYAVQSALGADHSHPSAVVDRPKAHDSVTAQQYRTLLETAPQTAPLHDFTNRSKGRPAGAGTGGVYAAPTAPRTPPAEPVGAAYTPPAVPPDPGAGDDPPRGAGPTAPIEECVYSAPPVETAPLGGLSPRPPDPVPVPDPWRVVGEAFRTYVVVERGDTLTLIDKHAAHERMNFDRMRAQDYAPMAQFLLSPVVFTPEPEEGALLLENLPLLAGLGFEVEDFGGGTLAVRQIPDYLDPGDVPAALTEAAGKLRATGDAGETQRRDEILHTMACKAAIKGGWKTSEAELERVVKAVMDGDVQYCPHGRPVAVELTRPQLEKLFKRRV